MDVRSLGYRTDLMIRALEGSHIADRGSYLVVRSPASPDYWWGNFLLFASPPQRGEGASWLEAFGTEFPGARHVALGVDVTEISAVDVNELTRAGLTMDRTAVLTAQQVREPSRPNRSAEVRLLAGDRDWAQAAELMTAVNLGTPGGDPGFVRTRIAAERSLTDDGHAIWFGAFGDGRLVSSLGLVTDGSGIARYQNVETHPDARRQGLASTLVWHAASYALGSLGVSTLVLLADPRAAAIRIYRALGFADAETQVGFERPPGSASG